jgi:hypothetical protein
MNYAIKTFINAFKKVALYWYAVDVFSLPNLNLKSVLSQNKKLLHKKIVLKKEQREIGEEKKKEKFLWKFKRNISFYFDSAILLSVKQIIIQKLGVKNKKWNKRSLSKL